MSSIKKSVFVALFGQQAKRVRRIILSPVASRAPHFFAYYLTKSTIFRGKPTEHKFVFWFSLRLLSEKFLILRNLREIKGSSRNRPEQAQGVSGRLRPPIFLTFGTTRVVGRQPYAPAAFTSGEIPGTYPKAHGSVGRSHGKNPQWHHRESIPGPSD